MNVKIGIQFPIAEATVGELKLMPLYANNMFELLQTQTFSVSSRKFLYIILQLEIPYTGTQLGQEGIVHQAVKE